MSEQNEYRDKQRKCSIMLPHPGGQVVRQLLDDIAAIEQERDALKESNEKVRVLLLGLNCDCFYTGEDSEVDDLCIKCQAERILTEGTKP